MSGRAPVSWTCLAGPATQSRMVIYTNRKVKDEYADFVKPIKFNAYDEPQLSVQLRQARIEQEGRAVPQYIQYYAETDEDQLQSYYWETWWYGCSTLNLELPTRGRYLLGHPIPLQRGAQQDMAGGKPRTG